MPGAKKAVYELTDLAEISKALQDVNKREKNVDGELDQLFANRTSLQAKLDQLQTLQPTLERVREDADALFVKISETCRLAEDVSGKVRELDLTQSRMVSTLKRIDTIIHLKECGEKVQQALAREDYEEAAKHVGWFLEEESSLPDEAGKSDMRSRIKLVQEKILTKFRAAAHARNHQNVFAYTKLLSRVGLRAEGTTEVSRYVQEVVRSEAEKLIDEAARVSPPPYLALVSSLLETFAGRIDQVGNLAEECFGQGTGQRILQQVFSQGDEHTSSVLRRYIEYRNLANRIKDANASGGTVGGLAGALAGAAGRGGPGGAGAGGGGAERDVRELDVLLDEAAMLAQRCEQYHRFLKNTATNAYKAAGGEAGLDVPSMIRGSISFRVLQELISHYVGLEQIFMQDNVGKAIRIEEAIPGGYTTSLVDEVFFVMRKSAQRAIATGSAAAVTATLSNLVGVLGKEYKEALRRRLKETGGGDVGAKVFAAAERLKDMGTKVVSGATAAVGAGAAAGQAGAGPSGGAAAAAPVQKITFQMAVNNCSVSAEYVEKLRGELEAMVDALFSEAAGSSERTKARALLDELRQAATGFTKLAQEGMSELCGQVTSRMRPLLDGFNLVRYTVDEAQFSDYEVNDPWVHAFIAGLDPLLRPMQASLTGPNYEELLALVMQTLAKQLEQSLFQKRFNQLGGLQLDREIRALVTCFSEMTQRTARDKFARLTQMASILNLEKVGDLLEFWGDTAGSMAWRLTVPEVKKVLALRVDFAQKAIDALKLK